MLRCAVLPRLTTLALAAALLPLSSCYQHVTVDPHLDPVVHCEEREYWACRRELDSGRFSEAQHGACQARIVCGGALWPSDCLPVESEHEQCIARLRDPSAYDLTTAEVYRVYDDCSLCER